MVDSCGLILLSWCFACDCWTVSFDRFLVWVLLQVCCWLMVVWVSGCGVVSVGLIAWVWCGLVWVCCFVLRGFGFAGLVVLVLFA